MSPRELSRGARRCLDRLIWYTRRYGRVHPSQKKLAKGLGICDRQLRTYLAELRSAGLVEIHQGGDGHPASYHVSSAATSGLTSRLVPGCFQAEIAVVQKKPAPNQPLAAKNFRAETRQSKSNCSYESNQSKCTDQERQQQSVAVTEPSSYENAQTDAIANAVKACGFAADPNLLARLERQRRFYGVTGFRVAAVINRAFKIVAGTSNHPRKPQWISAVVENDLSAIGRRSGIVSGRSSGQSHNVAAAFPPQILAMEPRGEMAMAIARTRRTKGLELIGDVIPTTLRDLIGRLPA